MTADLRPEGDLTVVAASHLRDQWLAWLTETAGADFAAWPEVGMDLSAVEAFDSAGVQMLLALRASLATRGQSLRLLAPPECVGDALQRFDLGQVLLGRKASGDAASKSPAGAAA